MNQQAEQPQVAKTRRSLIGRVVSDKMQKTLTVLVERRVKHPVIGKFITRSQKFHAHVESDDIHEGDVVEIVETRPVSKTKSWKVSRLIQRSSAV